MAALNDHRSGDTWLGLPGISIDIDEVTQTLTGGTVVFTVRNAPKKSASIVFQKTSADGGITISGTSATIASQIVTLRAGVYYWDIEFTLPSGRKISTPANTWTITEDIT